MIWLWAVGVIAFIFGFSFGFIGGASWQYNGSRNKEMMEEEVKK